VDTRSEERQTVGEDGRATSCRNRLFVVGATRVEVRRRVAIVPSRSPVHVAPGFTGADAITASGQIVCLCFSPNRSGGLGAGAPR
jgi:hypothetical protein